MKAKLIPYHVTRLNRVDTITGASMGYLKIEDVYYLYDVESESITYQGGPFDDVRFLDSNLKKSSSIIIRKNEKRAILKSVKDLENILWFDSITIFDTETIVAERDGRFGVIDHTFKMILFFEYDFLEPFEYNGTTYLYAKKGTGGVKIITMNGLEVSPEKFEEIKNADKESIHYHKTTNKQDENTLTSSQAEEFLRHHELQDIGHHWEYFSLRDMGNNLFKITVGSVDDDGSMSCNYRYIYKDIKAWRVEEISNAL